MNGTQADVGIRGSDFNGTLLLVDGQPMTDPQSGHLSADFDVPLDAVERIEVLAGGGSALWGSNAVGGVVNIVTRGADLGRSNMQCETRYSHGSALSRCRRLSRRDEDRRVLLGGGRLASDRELGVPRRHGVCVGPRCASPGAGTREWAPSRSVSATQTGTSAPTRSTERPIPNQQESTRTRTAALSSTLAVGGWTLTPSASVRAHHDDFVLERSNPSFYENLHDTVSSVLRAAARHALLDGTFAVGAEAARETISSTNLGSHGRDHGALFAEFARAWDPASPSPAGLHAGLRVDLYEGYGSRLSPYAGVAWDAARTLTFRASFGSSFRVPSFTELYYVDPQNVGNPNLRPEKAWQVEAGAEPRRRSRHARCRVLPSATRPT